MGFSAIALVVRDFLVLVGSLSSNICTYVPNSNISMLKSREGYPVMMNKVLMFLEMPLFAVNFFKSLTVFSTTCTLISLGIFFVW